MVLEPAADALDRYANHPFTMLCIVALRESSGNRVWWVALCAGERRFTAGASPSAHAAGRHGARRRTTASRNLSPAVPGTRPCDHRGGPTRPPSTRSKAAGAGRGCVCQGLVDHDTAHRLTRGTEGRPSRPGNSRIDMQFTNRYASILKWLQTAQTARPADIESVLENHTNPERVRMARLKYGMSVGSTSTNVPSWFGR